jgi:hypothetical protein
MLILGCRSAKDATCRIVPPKSKVTICESLHFKGDVQATRQFALSRQTNNSSCIERYEGRYREQPMNRIQVMKADV